MQNTKISNIGKLLFSISIGITIFFVIPKISSAETQMDDSTILNPVDIKLIDNNNGVNSISLKQDNDISKLFDSGGDKLTIGLDIYSLDDDATYTLNEKYGPYFSVDTNKSIRVISGSFLSVQEDDDGFYDPDDTVYFKMKYDGTDNKIWIDENKSEVSADDTDWDVSSDSFLENIDGKITIIVPLTLIDGISTTTKDGKKIIEGTNILVTTSAKATITINKQEIKFDNGLKTIGEGSGENSTGEDTTQTYKEIKFDGQGLKKPSTESYKGISQEGNLETFIVGLTNFVLSFVAAIAVLMLIYGGYLWIVDQGDDQMNEKAKKIIAGSVIGILLIISAYTIVNTIIRLEGNTYEGCNTSFEVGNGTNFDLNCNTDSGTMVGAGIGGLVGGAIGGAIGGDDGALIGGLLGGVGGGVIGSP